MERLTHGTQLFGDNETQIYYNKLKEYEDLEEIFRSKMTDAACEFLKDKEEFTKWLDRNKWIAKKCDEYARAEEEGKLLKLPCAVWDTVYEIDEFENEITKRKVYQIEVDDCAVTIMVSETNGCSPYTGRCIDDFGKTVFLTRKEAEATLKELEEG